MNRSFPYIVFGILLLGIIGFITRMVSDPVGFLRNILVMAIVLGIGFMIFKRLTKDKPDKKEQRAFLKAARQSKKRLKGRDSSVKGRKDNVAQLSSAKSQSKKRIRKKSDIHLTVIEGKKNKKKNRALF